MAQTGVMMIESELEKVKVWEMELVQGLELMKREEQLGNRVRSLVKC